MGIPVEFICRTLIAAALVVSAAVLTGCGDDASKLPVRTIYLSVPQQGELAARGDDMEDAVKLALDQTNSDTPDVRVELKILDSADEEANVARARNDETALAYIYEAGGGFGSIDGDGGGSSLLGISLSPSTGKLKRELVLGLATIHLLPSADDSGAALAQAVAETAPDQALLYVGDSAFARSAAAGFRRAIAGTPIKLREQRERGGSGLNAVTGADSATVFGADRPQSPNPSTKGTMVTPALPPAGYPPNGKKFFEWFEDAYGRQPDRWAVWAYEAVGLAMNAITDAGEGDGATDQDSGAAAVTRDSTRDAAFAITNRFGPVGHYDILPDGTTTLYAFAIRPWPIDAEAEAEDPRVIEVNR